MGRALAALSHLAWLHTSMLPFSMRVTDFEAAHPLCDLRPQALIDDQLS